MHNPDKDRRITLAGFLLQLKALLRERDEDFSIPLPLPSLPLHQNITGCSGVGSGGETTACNPD
jgi:hypothetical protein